MVSNCIRNQAEQTIKKKPVKMLSPQFLPPCSCIEILPFLPAMMNCNLEAKIISFPARHFWSQCFSQQQKIHLEILWPHISHSINMSQICTRCQKNTKKNCDKFYCKKLSPFYASSIQMKAHVHIIFREHLHIFSKKIQIRTTLKSTHRWLDKHTVAH